LPVFGEFRKKRDEITQNYLNQVDLLDDEFKPDTIRPARQPQKEVPRLVDVRGIALDRITEFKHLEIREPAVAIIDDVRRSIIDQCIVSTDIFSFVCE
jgi:hypothetical protein